MLEFLELASLAFFFPPVLISALFSTALSMESYNIALSVDQSTSFYHVLQLHEFHF